MERCNTLFLNHSDDSQADMKGFTVTGLLDGDKKLSPLEVADRGGNIYRELDANEGHWQCENLLPK